MDDGDIMCHPILVPSYLQEFDDANAKVGAEQNPQQTEVIYNVNDLDAAPLEWRIHEVQNMAKSLHSHSEELALGVISQPGHFQLCKNGLPVFPPRAFAFCAIFLCRCWTFRTVHCQPISHQKKNRPRQCAADQLLAKADPCHARTSSAVSGPADRICSPPGKSWESASSATSCEYMATRSFRNSVFDVVGQRSHEGLLTGFTEDSSEQHSVRDSVSSGLMLPT